MTDRPPVSRESQWPKPGHEVAPGWRVADRPPVSGEPPTNIAGGPLLEPHDGGCSCWPHVSQQDAVRAVEHAALIEYRSQRASTGAALDTEAVALLREWVDHHQPEGYEGIQDCSDINDRTEAFLAKVHNETSTGAVLDAELLESIEGVLYSDPLDADDGLMWRHLREIVANRRARLAEQEGEGR